MAVFTGRFLPRALSVKLEEPGAKRVKLEPSDEASAGFFEQDAK